MNNKQSLISVSTLTYIWQEKQMDNIDLLKPFVICAIYEKYNFQEQPAINEKVIADKINEKFGFDDLPIGVIKKVLERICKKTDYIIRDHNKYHLVKDLSKEYKNFTNKHVEAENNISFVLDEFKKKLISYGILNDKSSDVDVQNIIFEFLEKNGYIIVKNVDSIGKIDDNVNNKAHLALCRIIIEEADKNSTLFKSFLKVVEGYMLSNVIYLQIENNNLSTLKKLDVYLDSPLILEALGYKNDQDNKMTFEMIELLKKQGAKVKCFTKNFKEVYGFLENYKHNIHKNKRNNKCKTIEMFDANNFTEEEVENVVVHLENLVREKGIIIEDTPCLDTKTNAENQKYVINFKDFKEYIKHNYSDSGRENDDFIENDIESINAIAIIRKNIKYKNIDECKAIFVTKNTDLVYLANKYLKYKPFEDFGLIISDTDLITLLWQKGYSQNKELSRIKIISNALAGYDPPVQMLNKISTIVKKMEKAGIKDDIAVISDVLSSHTKKVDLMEITEGNPANLNEEKLLKVINKENDKKVYKLSNKIENLEKEISTLKQENENESKAERMKLKTNAEKITNKIINIMKKIWLLILIILFGLLIFSSIMDFIEHKEIKIYHVVLLLATLTGYILSFSSKFNYFEKIADKFRGRIENYVYNKLSVFKSKL